METVLVIAHRRMEVVLEILRADDSSISTRICVTRRSLWNSLQRIVAAVAPAVRVQLRPAF